METQPGSLTKTFGSSELVSPSTFLTAGWTTAHTAHTCLVTAWHRQERTENWVSTQVYQQQTGLVITLLLADSRGRAYSTSALVRSICVVAIGVGGTSSQLCATLISVWKEHTQQELNTGTVRKPTDDITLEQTHTKAKYSPTHLLSWKSHPGLHSRHL